MLLHVVVQPAEDCQVQVHTALQQQGAAVALLGKECRLVVGKGILVEPDVVADVLGCKMHLQEFVVGVVGLYLSDTNGF